MKYWQKSKNICSMNTIMDIRQGDEPITWSIPRYENSIDNYLTTYLRPLMMFTPLRAFCNFWPERL